MTDGQPIDMQRAVVCPHCGHVHPNRRVKRYSDFLDVCVADPDCERCHKRIYPYPSGFSPDGDN